MKRTLRWAVEATNGRIADPKTVDLDAFEVDLALVETDSRQCTEGSTYIARVGENLDGHDYGPQAEQNGAVLLVVERPLESVTVPQLVVEEATLALGVLAKKHLADLRQEGDVNVIGVTGSAGKTTTKDLLAGLLSDFGPTVAPILSFNNEVGCPLTVLDASSDTKYLVLEMGSSGPTHLEYLTDIAPLDVAVVLMVGTAHMEGFGDVETLAAAKEELVAGLIKGGTAVLNLDDPAVRAMQPEPPSKTIWFSASNDEGAQLRADHVTVDSEGHARFQLFTDQFDVSMRLGLVGAHQVSNALAALGVLEALGLDVSRGARKLPQLGASSPHRMAIHRIRAEGCKVGREMLMVDDSYNANPDSMKAAFKVAEELAAESGGRPVLVLGEMLELGSRSDEMHEEVAAAAEQISPHFTLLYGPGAHAYAGGLADVAFDTAKDEDRALRLLTANIGCQDVVLLKGSNGSGVWRLADRLAESGLPAAPAHLEEGDRR